MRMLFAQLALAAGAAAISVASMGCNADIHDNTADVHDNNTDIEDANVEFSTSADVDSVAPGQAIPVVINAENVFLIDPASEPPPDRVETAGHFQIYFDSMDSTPIMITASKSISVTIPANAAPGSHNIGCRVHKHDGTPTSAIFELDVTVVVR